jgi:nucleoside-diphosphate-sugar epimerase
MILATGAMGNVGAELVRALAGGGEQVRALIRRDADRAKLPAGVDAIVADLSGAETLVGAVDGVSAIHLLSGYEGMERLLADASRARVERVGLCAASTRYNAHGKTDIEEGQLLAGRGRCGGGRPGGAASGRVAAKPSSRRSSP